MEVSMTDQHFHDQHRGPFWTGSVLETFIIIALEAAVIGSFILALSSLAQYKLL
jgi:hypothetical protein